MKRFTLYILLLFGLLTAQAQANYQVSVADRQRIVTGSQSFQKDDREIMANALMWAIERGGQLKELITDIDYEKMRFTMDYNIIREGQSSFAAKLTIQVGQGRMVYLVNNIKGQTSGFSGMLGAAIFDKMSPEKKPKQKIMIEEFESANKKELLSLFEYINYHNKRLEHWNSIIENRIEKGMDVDDVTLILGKPIDIQKSGETTQYMYNTFTYVFFENGEVKSFMQ
ncbi:MAG: hypothetical protein IJ540_07870 [Prevotella sp.]|nr:hypothetical protein [Prevotella sp.]